jgi:hypothetical protein
VLPEFSHTPNRKIGMTMVETAFDAELNAMRSRIEPLEKACPMRSPVVSLRHYTTTRGRSITASASESRMFGISAY